MSGILDLLNPVKAITDIAGSIIDKFVTDPKDKVALQQQLLASQTQLSTISMQLDAQINDAQSKVIVAEAQSQSWLTRNWRPLLMCVFMTILVNNYLLAPWFGFKALDMVPDMWSLLKIGVGGYVMGRSGEKIIPGLAAALKS